MEMTQAFKLAKSNFWHRNYGNVDEDNFPRTHKQQQKKTIWLFDPDTNRMRNILLLLLLMNLCEFAPASREYVHEEQK